MKSAVRQREQHGFMTESIVDIRGLCKDYQDGDTVARVAQRYRVTAAQVADWNDVGVKTAFKVGHQVVLYMPVRVGAAPATSGGHAARGSRSSNAKKPAVRQTATKKAPSKRSTSTTKKKR